MPLLWWAPSSYMLSPCLNPFYSRLEVHHESGTPWCCSSWTTCTPLSTLPCRPVGEGPGCIRRSQWKKWTKQTDIRTRQITEKLSELPNTQSDGCFWKVRWADVDSCDERKETDLAPGKYDESEPSKSEFRKWDDDINIVCTPATRWRNMKMLGLWFG